MGRPQQGKCPARAWRPTSLTIALAQANDVFLIPLRNMAVSRQSSQRVIDCSPSVRSRHAHPGRHSVNQPTNCIAHALRLCAPESRAARTWATVREATVGDTEWRKQRSRSRCHSIGEKLGRQDDQLGQRSVRCSRCLFQYPPVRAR
jgi:hypothetical protein